MASFDVMHDWRCPECGVKLKTDGTRAKLTENKKAIEMKLTITCPNGHKIEPSPALRGQTQFFS